MNHLTLFWKDKVLFPSPPKKQHKTSHCCSLAFWFIWGNGPRMVWCGYKWVSGSITDMVPVRDQTQLLAASPPQLLWEEEEETANGYPGTPPLPFHLPGLCLRRSGVVMVFAPWVSCSVPFSLALCFSNDAHTARHSYNGMEVQWDASSPISLPQYETTIPCYTIQYYIQQNCLAILETLLHTTIWKIYK